VIGKFCRQQLAKGMPDALLRASGRGPAKGALVPTGQAFLACGKSAHFGFPKAPWYGHQLKYYDEVVRSLTISPHDVGLNKKTAD
jgi:hypothetical protein